MTSPRKPAPKRPEPVKPSPPAKPKAKPKTRPKGGKAPERKRPKQRFPWEKWKAEFVASDPEKIPQLVDFFEPLGVSGNTWRRRTSNWHRERIAYRVKIASDGLLRFRRGATDVLVDQIKMNRMISTLAFNSLVVKDPDTGDPTLAYKVKVKDNATGKVSYRYDPLSASEVIRLFAEGTRNANRAFGLDRAIHGLEALPGYDVLDVTAAPSPGGVEPAALPLAVDDDLRDLRSILKDPEGLKHAIALLKAVDAPKKGGKK